MHQISKWKVIVKKLEVRRNKQMTSKKVRSLKKNEVLVVKSFYKNSALIVEPCQGWINIRSGNGDQFIGRITSKRHLPLPEEIVDNDGMSTHITSVSWEASDDSVSRSRSQSRTRASRSTSRERTSVKRKSIQEPSEKSELVMVEDTYGVIVSKSRSESSEQTLYKILLDNQSEAVLLDKEDVTFLSFRPDILYKEEQTTRSRYVRENTSHNRGSTLVPSYIVRRSPSAASKEVRWSPKLNDYEYIPPRQEEWGYE